MAIVGWTLFILAAIFLILAYYSIGAAIAYFVFVFFAGCIGVMAVSKFVDVEADHLIRKLMIFSLGSGFACVTYNLAKMYFGWH